MKGDAVSSIQVEAKVLGQKYSIFSDYQIPIPPKPSDAGRITLRELISLLVIKEVEAFRQRQEERRLLRVLSPEEIDAGAKSGKINLEERETKQEADEGEAIATALQAFEDGLYYVFLDGVQQEELEQTVFVAKDSKILFLRLVALSGG
jgi:hypothetical protein